jgi:DNA-binding HxlR family transcriptional regulator
VIKLTAENSSNKVNIEKYSDKEDMEDYIDKMTMEGISKGICLCPLEGVITTISKKWALLIVSALGHQGRLRFHDFMDTLEGISPKALTDLLKELQKKGLIQREAFSEIPPRVEYFLTDDGKRLCKAIIPLIEWAEKEKDLHHEMWHSSCQNAPKWTVKQDKQ